MARLSLVALLITLAAGLAPFAAAQTGTMPQAPAAAAPAVAAVAVKVPPTLQRIRDTGVITIAHREASIPFSYYDASKKPVGYALELCLRVADALRRDLKMPNLRVELLPVSTATRIPAIAEGKADLECGSTTNNASRRKQVAFTVPHYFAGARVLVKAGSGIQRLSDLRGKRVVTTAGTSSLTLLRNAQEKGLIDARIIEAKDHDASFATLERGHADAFVMDDILLYSYRAGAKDPKQWDVVGEMVTVEPLAIMLRKGDPEFKKYVDGVLSRLMIDGEVRALYNKWFLAAIPPKNINLNVPLSPLLREQFLFPSDKVGDEVGG